MREMLGGEVGLGVGVTGCHSGCWTALNSTAWFGEGTPTECQWGERQDALWGAPRHFPWLCSLCALCLCCCWLGQRESGDAESDLA